jgi:hypothetical protein
MYSSRPTLLKFILGEHQLWERLFWMQLIRQQNNYLYILRELLTKYMIMD